MVKVGIFWVVEGKIYAYAEDRQAAQFSGREELSQILQPILAAGCCAILKIAGI